MDTRVAIVGMSAILPSGESVRESWEAIREGLDCLSDLPADRVDVTAYFNPDKTVKDKIYCKRGGFMPNYDFDTREFGMNMLQMEDCDSNQTLTLLKVKEALDDAKIQPFSKDKKNIGCVLGIGGGQKASHEFYSRLNYVVVDKVLRKMGMPEADVEAAVEKFKANFPEWRLDSFPGFLGNVTAGRCTNTFNMEGMNCVVDAACASSLIALKVATEELLFGDVDAMIAGATCTDNALGMYMAFSKTPVFSTDQSCLAYDEKTKGMLIGEGSAMFVLKRYADAVRDGDTIHAVIRSCASSSDGKSSGIYTPTISGQEEAIRRAYRKAGVPPETVTLVEGHGTGTPVGDKIELTALRNVFQEAYGPDSREQIAVGSIKSQIGHLKAVAGFAGLVKLIMALKHKTLPQSINVENPPNLMDGTVISDSVLYINTMNRPWFTAPGVPRRCGISSFGFGGANYHAVLEEFEQEHEKPYRLNVSYQPVVLHAKSASMLKSLCEQQLAKLEAAIAQSSKVKNTDYIEFASFQDAYKLQGPIPADHARVGFASKTIQETVSALKAIVARFSKDISTAAWNLPKEGALYRASALISNNGKGVAALFSGQGAQYTHMFNDVAMQWPEFRSSIQDMEKVQSEVMDKSVKRISQVMFPRKPYAREAALDNKEISKTEYSQMSTVASSVGLYEIFQSAGFAPEFVAGHSLGEFSALYASGHISREELFKLVCHRSLAMRDAPKKTSDGSMAAVIGPNASSIKLSTPDVYVANSNSPSQTVITGCGSGIQEESAKLVGQGFRVVHLACDGAFHSPHMENAEKQFQRAISSARFSKPAAGSPTIFSNVTGGAYTDVKAAISKHMTSSVQFLNLVKNMHAAGARVFIEFGPKQVLSKLVSEILPNTDDVITISVNPSSSKDSDIQLRQAAVAMAVAGVTLSGFDKWELRDVNKMVPIENKKTTLTLSASTYVSQKTIKTREAIMNDGKQFGCIASVGCGSAVSSAEVDSYKAQVAQKSREITSLNAQNSKMVNELEAIKAELAALKQQKQSVDQSAAIRSQAEMIARHKALLQAMLQEAETGAVVDYSKFLNGSVAVSQTAAPVAAPRPVAVVAAAPKPAASGANNALLAKAERVVLEVLASKTGYETELIELDMELETELGIDSIKRVEILSEVQAQLDVEAKDVDALSRTRTVGEVIDAMKAEISGGAPVAAAAAAPVVVAAATPAPKAAAGGNSALLAKAERVVLEVLASKTGYETELIELDMELETELGIDSIKRVEILSEVQAQLDVEAKDVDALSRTRTVGEVIDAMKAEISGGAPVAAASAAPVVVAAATPAPKAAAAGGNSALLAKAEQVVLEVLASKTGYETELIELDMELETELGIDSIKRVEILSEVQAQLDVEAKDVDALSRTRTVGEVIDAMKAEISGGAPVAVAPKPIAVAAKHVAAPVDSGLLAKAEQVVLEVLASKTGYETELIELDMELETELGIDSIKRVEILSEVQASLNIEAKDVDALSRTRTVGEVIDAMKSEILGCNVTLATADDSTIMEESDDEEDDYHFFDHVYGTGCEELSLCYSNIKTITRPEKLVLENATDRPIIIVDCGSQTTLELAKNLGLRAVVSTFRHQNLAQRGFTGRSVTLENTSEAEIQRLISHVESTYGTVGGFVFQHFSTDNMAEQLGWLLMAAKHLKKSLTEPIKNGRTFFLAVARMNGKLGLETPMQADDAIVETCARAERGAVFGLCKTLDLEWPNVFSRGVDIAEGMSPKVAAELIEDEISCANLSIRESGYSLDGKRYTTEAHTLRTGKPHCAIKKTDAFLVSGGARGITPLCVREIVRIVRGGTYVLMGRSKLTDEPAWAVGKTGKDLDKAALQFLKDEHAAGRGAKPTPKMMTGLLDKVHGTREVLGSVANIEAHGGKAIYLSCDVSSAQAVKSAVRDVEKTHNVRITGIIHASGVLRDKLVENKTLDDFEAVYGTKITGLLNLLSAVRMTSLRHLVMFSSLAGYHGNVGQADYAMANESLNKIGFQLSSTYPQLCVKSICFGPWDGGMVTPALKKQFESMGVQIIPRDGGAETVARIVLSSAPTQVLVGNWGVPPVSPLSKSSTISQIFTPEVNPFLSSHQIQGKNVLPMTVTIGYMAHVVRNLYAGHYLWCVEDAQLFRGITIDQAVECQIKLNEKSTDDGKVKVEAVMSVVGENGKFHPSYKAVIVLGKTPRPAFIFHDFSLRTDANTTVSETQLYDGKTLFHGPMFRGIKKILSVSDAQLTAECINVPLTNAECGQFANREPLNAFMTDVAFQAMLIWARKIRKSASLPNHIERLDVYKPIMPGAKYYTTLETGKAAATGPVVKSKFYMHDEQGEVYVSGRASVVLNDNMSY